MKSICVSNQDHCATACLTDDSCLCENNLQIRSSLCFIQNQITCVPSKNGTRNSKRIVTLATTDLPAQCGRCPRRGAGSMLSDVYRIWCRRRLAVVN